VLPDADVRAFVQRALGYSLLGHTREQCFFILHGTGCNGKSVFLNTIKAVLGEDCARQADPECFMSGKASTMRNDLARLQGVRFVTSVESGDGQRLDEALIKSITRRRCHPGALSLPRVLRVRAAVQVVARDQSSPAHSRHGPPPFGGASCWCRSR